MIDQAALDRAVRQNDDLMAWIRQEKRVPLWIVKWCMPEIVAAYHRERSA